MGVLVPASRHRGGSVRVPHALLELHKRRIRETRITNNLYAELHHQLRRVFLDHGLAEKSKGNRKFFEKWLTDPVVEMGWTPAGGWTSARVSDLYADLETLAGGPAFASGFSGARGAGRIGRLPVISSRELVWRRGRCSCRVRLRHEGRG